MSSSSRFLSFQFPPSPSLHKVISSLGLSLFGIWREYYALLIKVSS
ncbi:hypothetical protein Hanom_Chr16g01483111 [Helianthus anomalus]